VPDHSTFSKNRHGRFRESDAFRKVFESVVERCMKEGLVGGEGFAIDASVIKADANRSRSTAREGAEVLRDPRHATGRYASIWRRLMSRESRSPFRRRSRRRIPVRVGRRSTARRSTPTRPTI
jgi:hypothetical protein